MIAKEVRDLEHYLVSQDLVVLTESEHGRTIALTPRGKDVAYALWATMSAADVLKDATELLIALARLEAEQTRIRRDDGPRPPLRLTPLPPAATRD